MKIIDEYKRLTEEIAVLESNIASINREIEKLFNTYKPGDIKAIDYVAETIKASKTQSSLLFTTDCINKKKMKVRDLKIELNHIISQRKKLENTINSYSDCKKKIIMRRIKGDTVNDIACEFNYSKAHVRRLSREL